jgi:hypothetical protein
MLPAQAVEPVVLAASWSIHRHHLCAESIALGLKVTLQKLYAQ